MNSKSTFLSSTKLMFNIIFTTCIDDLDKKKLWTNRAWSRYNRQCSCFLICAIPRGPSPTAYIPLLHIVMLCCAGPLAVHMRNTQMMHTDREHICSGSIYYYLMGNILSWQSANEAANMHSTNPLCHVAEHTCSVISVYNRNRIYSSTKT